MEVALPHCTRAPGLQWKLRWGQQSPLGFLTRGEAGKAWPKGKQLPRGEALSVVLQEVGGRAEKLRCVALLGGLLLTLTITG